MKLVVAAAMLLLSANFAQALDPPVYDSDHFCKTTTAIFPETMGTLRIRDTMIENCMKEEERRAAQIKRVISEVELDDATITGCDTLARAYAGGSYQGFAGCVVLNIGQRILEGKLEVKKPTEK